VIVSYRPRVRGVFRLHPGRRDPGRSVGVGPQPRRRTRSFADRCRPAAGDSRGKIAAVTVAPVETVAAKVVEPEPIRHVTENPDEKPKPSRDGKQKPSDFGDLTEAPIRQASRPDGKPKSVTGRNNRTPLKTKPLLRLVPDAPSRDGKPRRSPTKSRKTAPPKTEFERLKKLLPDMKDSRWTVENEGYSWKVRRVWDRGNTTESTRYFRVRWVTWE
jgi:hypothetical protein